MCFKVLLRSYEKNEFHKDSDLVNVVPKEEYSENSILASHKLELQDSNLKTSCDKNCIPKIHNIEDCLNIEINEQEYCELKSYESFKSESLKSIKDYDEFEKLKKYPTSNEKLYIEDSNFDNQKITKFEEPEKSFKENLSVIDELYNAKQKDVYKEEILKCELETRTDIPLKEDVFSKNNINDKVDVLVKSDDQIKNISEAYSKDGILDKNTNIVTEDIRNSNLLQNNDIVTEDIKTNNILETNNISKERIMYSIILEENEGTDNLEDLRYNNSLEDYFNKIGDHKSNGEPKKRYSTDLKDNSMKENNIHDNQNKNIHQQEILVESTSSENEIFSDNSLDSTINNISDDSLSNDKDRPRYVNYHKEIIEDTCENIKEEFTIAPSKNPNNSVKSNLDTNCSDDSDKSKEENKKSVVWFIGDTEIKVDKKLCKPPLLSSSRKKDNIIKKKEN